LRDQPLFRSIAGFYTGFSYLPLGHRRSFDVTHRT
jgi:hypothetical protein